MSAREVIAAIEALSAKERALVFEFLHKADAAAQPTLSKAGVNPAVAESADGIFTKYETLFKNLAE